MSRLHVVTGKGGTGKTTVAAALALALAEEGQRTLLVEVEGRQGIAQLFETEALPYEERKIAVAPGGGEVYALAVDAEQALLDYLQMFYKLGGAGRALRKIGAIDFATTIAPGLRDVLLTGKVCEAVRRREKPQRSERSQRSERAERGERSGRGETTEQGEGSGKGREGREGREGRARDGRWVYDAVVMDAPPTGRIARFLGVNGEVAGLARVGPIHHQAQAVMRVLTSHETAVHSVTLLEEMPVQETVDGVEELRANGLPVGAVIVNMVRPQLLSGGDDRVLTAVAEHPEPVGVAKALSRAGLGGAQRGGRAERLVQPLLAQGSEHAERVALERAQRAELGKLGLPLYELGLLGDGVDLAGLYELAVELRRQWSA